MQQTGVLLMERAAQIRQTGGPDVIAWTDVELTAPGPGEVRMRNLAVGLNFIDTYHRGGLYPMTLPSGLGMEAAGIIEAVAEMRMAGIVDQGGLIGGPDQVGSPRCSRRSSIARQYSTYRARCSGVVESIIDFRQRLRSSSEPPCGGPPGRLPPACWPP
jgi:NADPH:quinone reductase-like Zn-dependent oxidoreductase